jgi:hypothetical protein
MKHQLEVKFVAPSTKVVNLMVYLGIHIQFEVENLLSPASYSCTLDFSFLLRKPSLLYGIRLLPNKSM